MHRNNLPVLIITAASCAAFGARPVTAGDNLPSPVKTCADVGAYIGRDNTMTMDTFKTLLTAGGFDMSRGENNIDMQCKLTKVVKNVVLSQHVLTTDDGREIRVTARVIDDSGICKLVNVAVSGC